MAGLKKARRLAAKQAAAKKPVAPQYQPKVMTAEEAVAPPTRYEYVSPFVMTTGDMGKP